MSKKRGNRTKQRAIDHKAKPITTSCWESTPTVEHSQRMLKIPTVDKKTGKRSCIVKPIHEIVITGTTKTGHSEEIKLTSLDGKRFGITTERLKPEFEKVSVLNRSGVPVRFRMRSGKTVSSTHETGGSRVVVERRMNVCADPVESPHKFRKVREREEIDATKYIERLTNAK